MRRSTLGQRRAGGAVLEAAIVLPVLLLLTFGAVEYGYFLYLQDCLQGAAREGARAAIVPDATSGSVQTAAHNAMQCTTFATRGWTCHITVDGVEVPVESVTGGRNVQVVVEARWGTAGVQTLGLINADRIVQGTAVMRKEAVVR